MIRVCSVCGHTHESPDGFVEETKRCADRRKCERRIASEINQRMNTKAYLGVKDVAREIRSRYESAPKLGDAV